MTGGFERIDCAFVDRWLDDYLAGRLSDADAAAITKHLTICERCRRLSAIVAESETGGRDAAGETAEQEDLLSGVLRRTTGSACARAETLLPGYVDGELDADSRDMLDGHVAHCSGCSQLLAALRDARQVLPTLAEIEPPLGFTARVLRATTAAPPRPLFGRAVWDFALRVLARPRASLEIAYVAAVLLVVVLGNPVAAFYQAEQHASQWAGAVPVGRLAEQLGVKDRTAGTTARVLAAVGSAGNAVYGELAYRVNQIRGIVQDIATAIADAIAWITNIDLKALLGGSQTPQPRGQPATSPAARPGAAEPGTRR